MHINIDRAIPEYYLSAFADMTYTALAQDVELLKADFLGSIHIPLCGRKPL